MRVLLLSLFTVFTVSAIAQERCTVIHVREAMELNRERRELYRQDGNPDAARVLNKLIFLEKLMLPFSASLDRATRDLQLAGVSMWCEDLVPMHTVPEYQAFTEAPTQSYRPFEKNIRKALTKKLRNFKFSKRAELYNDIAKVITIDLNDHSYNCLTRHFLEAAARSLLLSDKHYEQAPSALKADVEKALEKLLGQLSLALGAASSIDEKAAQVQARGVPVLCQEMPPIPWQSI